MEEDVAQELAALAKALAGEGAEEGEGKEATENDEAREASKRVRLTHRRIAVKLEELGPRDRALVEQLVADREKLQRLNEQIKKAVGDMQREVKEIEKRIKELDKELGPRIAQMEGALVEAEKWIVKYDPKKGRPSYKQAFEEALRYLNKKHREAVEAAKIATVKFTKFLKVDIQASEKKVATVRLASIFTWLKNAFNEFKKYLGLVDSSAAKLDDAVARLKDVVKSE